MKRIQTVHKRLLCLLLLLALSLVPAAETKADVRMVCVNELGPLMQIERKSRFPDLKDWLLLPGRISTLAALKVRLKEKAVSYGGNFSIYVKDLKTGESITINNRRMYAASLIKLYAMGAAYQGIRDGKQKEQDLSDKIRRMIASSDNECFNWLITKVGLEEANRWISRNGFADTQIFHGCLPAGNSFGTRSASAYNRTTVRDCGIFLENVYRGKCVDKAFSGKMLDHLKAQTRRGKIPAGIPSGVTVANKTGETDDTCHDAAIVFSPGGDYILVVMVTAPGNGWHKAGQIAELSAITYNYFNRKQGG